MTVPDGTLFNPGTAFVKTWRFKNASLLCTWDKNYTLVFTGGDQMSSTLSVPLGRDVAPGQTVDVSVNMIAPAYTGKYRGFWMLKSSTGKLFGTGNKNADPFWVDINVIKTSIDGTGYDFVTNACAATWTNANGVLPCPGSAGASQGYVLRVSNPRLENGSVVTTPGLLTVPQNIKDGYIQGIYPPFLVQPGDKFEATVNCERNAKACLVLFRLDYQIGNGPIFGFWSIGEVNDGKSYQASIDLSPFGGQEVKFVLQVQAFGPSTGDRALWVAPRIVRPKP